MRVKGPRVFLFNPLAEGYIAHGEAFAPVKHQLLLARDLCNLPQFLCEPDDVVLVEERPSAAFLNVLAGFGFAPPRFLELHEGRLDVDQLDERELAGLRPWAWGPDSVKLLGPLFERVRMEGRTARDWFRIAGLYSKAWSAQFLRHVLGLEAEAGVATNWLCDKRDAALVVNDVEAGLGAVDRIRAHGQHRVVVKRAFGLAGQNALRLWEPELLEPQRRWMARGLAKGNPLVVEPWRERELDFSVHFEMSARGIELCGYTGLLNDHRGQYQGNWAEPEYGRVVPARVRSLLGLGEAEVECLYARIGDLLEQELGSYGFLGPVSIDAFVYREPDGRCRLKPVVEINPRCTMGRLTLELMRRVSAGSAGTLRLVNAAETRRAGFGDMASYAREWAQGHEVLMGGALAPGILDGRLCLNDPDRAQVCLATFEVERRASPGEAS